MCAQVSPLQAILGPIYRRNKYSGHGHGGEVNLVFFERWSWSWGEVNLPVHTVSCPSSRLRAAPCGEWPASRTGFSAVFGRAQLTPLAAGSPASPAHRSFLARVPAGAKSRRARPGDCHRAPRQAQLSTSCLLRSIDLIFYQSSASRQGACQTQRTRRNEHARPAPCAQRNRGSHEQCRAGGEDATATGPDRGRDCWGGRWGREGPMRAREAAGQVSRVSQCNR